MQSTTTEYQYHGSDATWSDAYLWKPVLQILRENVSDKRIFELGCGNGATAKKFYSHGYEISGIDTSESGIQHANSSYPDLNLHVGDAYDNLSEQYGQFPCVISFEVIEHCFYPRKFMQTFYDLMEEGGLGILSTPYHGYIKNLSIALVNKSDFHYTALWDGGHIKFFSIKTMESLLREFGFRDIRFLRVGRLFKPLAKSMIVVFRK